MERYEERDQSVIREAALENGPVPQPLEMRRVLERLDRLMEKRDYTAAEKHLRYWLEEARAIRDPRGELAILGETVGFYRKTGKGPEALAAVEETLALLEAGNWGDSMMAGTALVNCGTACNAFGENERALQLFGRARRIYEKLPGVPASLLGGLYNNMGLACAAIGQTREALELYEAALGQMEKVPGGAAERAITCLNMADAVEIQEGPVAGEQRIGELLDRALELLEDPEIPRDGDYAYICGRCAPVFAHYGYFLDAQKLERRAEAFYAGT